MELALLGSIIPVMGADSPIESDAEHGSVPPVRKIPGITAPDQYPAGCVDCHRDYPEMKLDARLSTLMDGWGQGSGSNLISRLQALAPKGVVLKGRHPGVSKALRDIPGACIKCHAKASTKSPPFGQMMHIIHLVGVKDGHFLSIFQGECTHCHKLDKNTGTWRIPSGPERTTAGQGNKDESRIKQQNPATGRTAAGEGLYMFYLIMSVCIVTFLFLGTISVHAVTE